MFQVEKKTEFSRFMGIPLCISGTVNFMKTLKVVSFCIFKTLQIFNFEGADLERSRVVRSMRKT